MRGSTQPRGSPKGSTSNVFRTRAALLTGVVEGILKAELPAVDAGFSPDSPAELVEGLVGLLDVVTGPGLTATTARLVLFLEGSHDASLREALSAGRDQLVELISPSLRRLGARDPIVAAQTLAACMEGLILHCVARHDTSDARPLLRTVVQGALGS